MSRNAVELKLDDLEIKPNLITKLKNAGIESIFDLAVSIPHDLNDNMLSGTDKGIALDIVIHKMTTTKSRGASILVTGSTGTVGSELVKQLTSPLFSPS